MADDETSDLIVRHLAADGRISFSELARRVHLSTPAVIARVRKLEAAGVIRGYTAVIDREKVGLHVAAVAEVNLDRHSESQVQRFEDAVAASPQIINCVSATGPADYILTVLVQDMKHYERFLHETLFSLPGVTHVRSSIVLRQVKSEMALPIEQVAQPAAPARGRRR